MCIFATEKTTSDSMPRQKRENLKDVVTKDEK